MTYEILMSVTMTKVFEITADCEADAASKSFDLAEDVKNWTDADLDEPNIDHIEDITGLTKGDRAVRALRRMGINVTIEQLGKLIEEIKKDVKPTDTTSNS